MQLPCKLAKKRYSRQGKVIVLKIMKISQHDITQKLICRVADIILKFRAE